VNWVRHVPWHLYRGDTAADEDIPEEQLVDPVVADSPAGVREGLEREGITIRTRQTAPRAFQIRKEDAEKHGYTRGCAGCNSWFRGLGRQPHSQQCRARFEDLLKSDARYLNAERRKNEFEDKMRERAAKKRRLEEEKGRRRQREPEEKEEEARGALQQEQEAVAGLASSSSGGALQAPAKAGLMEVTGEDDEN
jgi:hypothetical protein